MSEEYVFNLPRDGSDVVGSFIVGPNAYGRPRREHFDPTPLINQGVTWLRICAHGNRIMAPDGADWTLCIDEPRIRVSIEGRYTIHCAGKRGVLIGVASAGSGPRPIHFDFLGGEGRIESQPNDQRGGKWTRDGYQWTGIDEGTTLNSERCVGDGHADYQRGPRGVDFIEVKVEAAYKEGLKIAHRRNGASYMPGEPHTKHTPEGTPWPGRPVFRYLRCDIRNFAISRKETDPTYGFGGGIIQQPNCGVVLMDGTTIDDSNDSGTMLFGMNGGVTLGAPGGQPADEAWCYAKELPTAHSTLPANGPVIAIRNRFIAPKRKGNVPRILIEDAVSWTDIENTYDLHPDARIEIKP